MTDFDIINAFKTYAESKGWQFVYAAAGTKANFEANIQTSIQQNNGQIVFICDAKPNAQYTELGKRTSIEYSCLVALGNKFDNNGNAADVNETHQQKHDRRFLPILYNAADTFIKEFTCQNQLQVVSSGMEPDFNIYDTNMDIVAITGLTFTQL